MFSVQTECPNTNGKIYYMFGTVVFKLIFWGLIVTFTKKKNEEGALSWSLRPDGYM